MKNRFLILVDFIATAVFSLGLTSCQKMYRPEMVIIPDPPPPPYNPLKSYWAFENSLVDSAENKLSATSTNTSYVAGVTGQALKVNENGYVLIENAGDTLKNLGSFTLSFWMNGVGPVQGGAQGLFSITNKNEFWGNLDLFLENHSNGNEGFLKVHMFNANAANGKGEQWNEVKIPNMLNKWTHIAITYNATNSQMSIYADGQPTALNNKVLDNGSYGAIKFNDVNGVVLGNYQFETNPSRGSGGAEPWARSFNGSLDQFRIYNKALTAAEITTLFNSKQ